MINLKKIFLLFNILLFFSCSETTNNEKSQTSNFKSSNPVHGTWRVSKDTSHVIKLTDKEWIDMYNGEVISANKIVYETKNYTGHNGRNMGQRKFIKLEESPGNFYNYHILECDSLHLTLVHIESGQEMEMRRE